MPQSIAGPTPVPALAAEAVPADNLILKPDHPILNLKGKNLTKNGKQGQGQLSRQVESGAKVLQIWHETRCSHEKTILPKIELLGLGDVRRFDLQRFSRTAWHQSASLETSTGGSEKGTRARKQSISVYIPTQLARIIRLGDDLGLADVA